LNPQIDITIRGIEEELYRQMATIAAREKKNIGVVINEAMRVFLTQSSSSALEAEYLQILNKIEEIDGMALAGAPGASVLIQEYKERLQTIKERMQQRETEEEEEENIPKISTIGEVKLTKSDLEQLGRIIIENCQKVRLEADVDPETLKSTIGHIMHVHTIEIPKHLYPLILTKARDCQAIARY